MSQCDLPLEPPGAAPLRMASRERYARFRARMFEARKAAELAGWSPCSGAHTKAEASRQVQDRIAWLTRQDEEILRDKLREIEERYWQAFRADVTEFYDADNQLLPLHDLSPDMRQIVEAVTCEKGKLNVKVMSKLEVSRELRKMLGGDAPTKIASTDPSGEHAIPMTATINIYGDPGP
jgi:hypothetical protein